MTLRSLVQILSPPILSLPPLWRILLPAIVSESSDICSLSALFESFGYGLICTAWGCLNKLSLGCKINQIFKPLNSLSNLNFCQCLMFCFDKAESAAKRDVILCTKSREHSPAQWDKEVGSVSLYSCGPQIGWFWFSSFNTNKSHHIFLFGKFQSS